MHRALFYSNNIKQNRPEKQNLKKESGVDKTRNIEHPGTFQNIPKYWTIITIMRKIGKIKFPKLKLGKKKLGSAQKKRKTKTKQNKHITNQKKKENKNNCNEWRHATSKTNPFLPVVRHRFQWLSLIPRFRCLKPCWRRSSSLFRSKDMGTRVQDNT